VREAAVEVDDGKLVVRVQAGDDRRWRGASAGIVAVEHDVAFLGPAPWVPAEDLDALMRLFEERLPATVAEFEKRDEVTLHLPTPSGTWVRLPGIVANARDIVITAIPINADAASVVAAYWLGLPAFTVAGLAGFLTHNVTGHMLVRRVDHLVRQERGIFVGSGHRPARRVHICTGWDGDHGS
jgi:hypothetical protein